MYALFFEVRPKPGHLPHYFEHVDRLRPVLAQHKGLLFLDRYRSLSDPQVLLSHQHWRDEAAILAWRRDSLHQKSQQAGRQLHFEDYRIRVASLTISLLDGKIQVAHSNATQTGSFVLAAYANTPCAQVLGCAHFESVNHIGSFLTMGKANTIEEATASLKAVAALPGLSGAYVFRVERDYGMFERAQAPSNQ